MRKTAGFISLKTMFIGTVLSIVMIYGGSFVYSRYVKASVSSFDECVAAGNPVMESYPEQCQANGQLFINDDQMIN